MEFLIALHRGDYYEYFFKIVSGFKRIFLSNNDNIIFSVKESIDSNDYLFQKNLKENNGIFYDSEQNCYKIIFTNEDTQNFEVGEYICDIVIVYNDERPETHLGHMTILPDVTRNEVQE